MGKRNAIDFIIIGAQKGGTTAAAYNLNMHAGLSLFSGTTEYGQHEIEFFNQHWDRGIQWYFDQLPESAGLVGEKTAELLHRTICHERIFITQPDVKLIVLLRSPIERAYSQWGMAAFNKKDENRSFEEVILSEAKYLNNHAYLSDFYSCSDTGVSTWREGYIIKGFYSDQLKSLFRFFNKEQIHIAISERVISSKKIEYNRIFSFLKLPLFFPTFEDRFVAERFVGKPPHYIAPSIRGLLQEIYAESNENLFNFLGFEIPEWK